MSADVIFTGRNSQIAEYFVHDYDYATYDLEDTSTWDTVLDCKYLFLLLPKHPNLLELSKQFMLAAADSGIDQIIKIGSLGPYRVIHQQLECFMRECRVAYTSFDIAPLMNNIFTEQYDKEVLENYRGEATAPYLDPRCLAKAIELCIGDTIHYNKNYAMTGPRQLSIADVSCSLIAGGWPVKIIDDIGYDATHASLRKLDADHCLMKQLGLRYQTDAWSPAVSNDWLKFNAYHRTLDEFIAQDSSIYSTRMELDLHL